MSQTQTQSKFAYGANNLGSCSCPAVEAGMTPTATSPDEHIPGLLKAAEQYDAILSEEVGGWDGLVPEEVAKDAWLAMIENCREETTEEAAKEVAIELGWMEDDSQ